MPIGACWARDDVAAAFSRGDHGSTFGGQPLAVRAALAVLDVMEAVDAPACAARAGAELAARLRDLPGILGVRGAGLLLAAELEPGIGAADVAARCLAAGLLVNPVTPTALRFAPSLLVTDDEIDAAMAILATVVAATPVPSSEGAAP
jgi:acetylornithine/N-succinyldiaminopimelate aminotransferase